ncbi:prepilin peptidase [Clavibacter sepedonicus]|uniref:Membrane protein n=1 Tax=Clavibacter sepedonicus TaxID=31964 RepID=B0RJC1_CLASE|nr:MULTISPECIES: A24 family peptidase [Clavibacter]MBD5382500.1 prepilin peptidase [Clavibacter sp.]OQJ45257.1 prepilin peptidase [Clavibacter sepedonicus]OQJ50943.1 prepilin peptidase [Clavibacter sepedonicus]UUK67252.1 A24 family peptidase [Clavibacter sepedonicus]CAQ03311.1 putative membrane protein [Clavibacter sepedonicus]
MATDAHAPLEDARVPLEDATATVALPAAPRVNRWSLVGAGALSAGILPLYATTPDHRAHAVTLVVIVAAFAGTLAVIDVRTLRLPNRLVGPLAVVGLVQAIGLGILTGDATQALVPLGAAGITSLLYLGCCLAKWMGYGDVKYAGALALSIAIYAGWAAIYLLPIAFTIGAIQRIVEHFTGLGRTGGRAHGPAITLAGIGILLLFTGPV